MPQPGRRIPPARALALQDNVIIDVTLGRMVVNHQES